MTPGKGYGLEAAVSVVHIIIGDAERQGARDKGHVRPAEAVLTGCSSGGLGDNFSAVVSFFLAAMIGSYIEGVD